MYILAPQTQYITHACKFVHKCKIFGALISYSKCSEGISVVIALILKAPMCGGNADNIKWLSKTQYTLRKKEIGKYYVQYQK